jgi:hypothetical protein
MREDSSLVKHESDLDNPFYSKTLSSSAVEKFSFSKAG